MYLVQLIYASRIDRENFPDNGARMIQEASAKNNRDLDITGVLFCDGTHFLQAIEGSRSNVSKLYNKIATDPRHLDVTILRMADVAVRDFAHWSMELLSYKADTVNTLKRFSISKDFDPFLLSADSLREVLIYLAEQQEVGLNQKKAS
ncbi:MAG: BLUF domain-containing protein [Bdellovibrionales bacterium]|nr:BLUF domain-containing protein [Bdellovibrionales bacterium]